MADQETPDRDDEAQDNPVQEPGTERGEEPGTQPIDSDVPTKVCAHCSTQSRTNGAFCPNCGKPFVHSRASRKTVKIAAIAIAALIVLGGGTAVISRTVVHNNEVVAQEAAAKKEKAAEVAVAAKVAAEEAAQEALDSAERDVRMTTVGEIEASITTDAQARVVEGILDGPIDKSSCTPLGGGSTDDLTAITTTFTCIAINKENADGTASGYRFSATMNWDDGSYTWHLGD
ncbi:zinc ribbon domain-containing protein [Cryobacterium sp. TMT2-42-4]|uniref:zinc ribbon domain-containing protein n=1 Tax=Cryobacterium sp. TMT2-42-4 TaxID=1259255 RepID=UPI00106D5859|nr:zinc ribbon domain-containing protein [Cryobacterium sp. TMT2-42-4]TFC36230.1 zinc ribbon domain-containing protein [Cryobacterium sp. TMT2-42-4]